MSNKFALLIQIGSEKQRRGVVPFYGSSSVSCSSGVVYHRAGRPDPRKSTINCWQSGQYDQNHDYRCHMGEQRDRHVDYRCQKCAKLCAKLSKKSGPAVRSCSTHDLNVFPW